MLYLLNLFLLFPYLLAAHPFHVSVCDISYNETAQSVEITHKIFLDDLERALKEQYGKKVDIVNASQEGQRDEMVSKYLQDHFSLSINDKEYKPDYVGSEVQADAIWCYQEIINVDTFSIVRVRNVILFELFEDQTNLVHVKKDKKLKSLRLHREKDKGIVKFK